MFTALFAIGASLCCLNAYASLARRSPERHTVDDVPGWIPDYPVVGSLLVVLGWLGLGAPAPLGWVALALVIVDAGGPHWFAITALREWLRARVRASDSA
jgi:hypothetical protein